MKNIFNFANTPVKLKTFGHSMQPVLLDQDLIKIKKISFSAVKIDDILILRKRGKNFVHRVIYKTSSYLVSKGDNNYLSDGKIYPKNIIGKVIEIERKDAAGKNANFNPEDIYLFQSSLYFAEITKLKTEMEKKNINFVFLKGLPLHLYIEKTYPKRLYLDFDLLIAKENFNRIQELLNKKGYRKSENYLSKPQNFLKNKITEISFIKMVKLNDRFFIPVIVDVHLEVVFMMTQIGKMNPLYPQKLIDQLTKKFLTEKRTVKIQNKKFPLLTQENLILYLALHFFHHNLKGIFRLNLLDKIIIKSLKEDKDILLKVFSKIKKYKLENFIYPVFMLLIKYYKTPINKRYLQLIKSDSVNLKFIKKNLLPADIFSGEERFKMGVKRFENLFFLSPNPLWKKILIFFNFQVIYLLFFVSITKMKRRFLFR